MKRNRSIELFYIESENYLVSPVRKREFRKQNSVGDDLTEARSREDSYYRDTRSMEDSYFRDTRSMEDSYFRDTDHIPNNMEVMMMMIMIMMMMMMTTWSHFAGVRWSRAPGW